MQCIIIPVEVQAHVVPASALLPEVRLYRGFSHLEWVFPPCYAAWPEMFISNNTLQVRQALHGADKVGTYELYAFTGVTKPFGNSRTWMRLLANIFYYLKLWLDFLSLMSFLSFWLQFLKIKLGYKNTTITILPFLHQQGWLLTLYLLQNLSFFRRPGMFTKNFLMSNKRNVIEEESCFTPVATFKTIHPISPFAHLLWLTDLHFFCCLFL